MNNPDFDACTSVAADIATWELAARRLPTPELAAMVASWQHTLSHSLDAFNDAYTSHADDGSADQLWHAIGEVTQAATAMAIFTLGIAYRASKTAQHN